MKPNIVDKGLTIKYIVPNYKNNAGARAANKKRFPDGYIYIVKFGNKNLYKIGVSQNPERRIKDIHSYSPYPIFVVGIYKFKDVYNIEEMIHDSLKNNKFRKEWFRLSDEEIIGVKAELTTFEEEGLILTKKYSINFEEN